MNKKRPEIDEILWENILFMAEKIRGWDIKQLRKQLSEHADISVTTFNGMNNGTKGIGKDILQRISDVVGVNVRLLLCGKMAYMNANCSVGCSDKTQKFCKKVKEIIESETHWGTSLEQNIDSFKLGLESDLAKGLKSGAHKGPVRVTGLRKKAG